MRNGECGMSGWVSCRVTSHCDSAFRIPNSALVFVGRRARRARGRGGLSRVGGGCVFVLFGFARLVMMPRFPVLDLRLQGGIGNARRVLEHQLRAQHTGPDDGHEPRDAQHPESGLLGAGELGTAEQLPPEQDRKSTRLNSSHTVISYAVFCLKKK